MIYTSNPLYISPLQIIVVKIILAIAKIFQMIALQMIFKFQLVMNLIRTPDEHKSLRAGSVPTGRNKSLISTVCVIKVSVSEELAPSNSVGPTYRTTIISVQKLYGDRSDSPAFTLRIIIRYATFWSLRFIS